MEYLDSGYNTKYISGDIRDIDFDNEYNEDGRIRRITYLGYMDAKYETSIFYDNNRVTKIENIHYEQSFDGSFDDADYRIGKYAAEMNPYRYWAAGQDRFQSYYCLSTYFVALDTNDSTWNVI